MPRLPPFSLQVQDLPLHFLDSTLLLPVVVEHTIDERSPLYGTSGRLFVPENNLPIGHTRARLLLPHILVFYKYTP